MEISLETFRSLCAQIKNRLGVDFKKLDNNDRFWLCYLCLKRDGKTSVDEVEKALKQAAFARNQSLALLITAALLFASTSGSNPASLLLSPCQDVALPVLTCPTLEPTKTISDKLAKRINTELLTKHDIARMAFVFSVFHVLFLLRYVVSYYHATKVLFRGIAALPVLKPKRSDKVKSSLNLPA